MLEKLAKQTAIYGISTIVVRFLNYLLTPYYTRIFEQGEYGIVTDIYALIPFALVVLSMGMESSFFRFTTRAEEQGGDVAMGKRKVFAYTVEEKTEREIPQPRKELPYFKEVKTAQELYLEGLHIEQYRSPEYSAD